MDDNASKGGSYIRQPDGSLTLVERTEPAKPETETEAKGPKAPAGKKVNTDG